MKPVVAIAMSGGIDSLVSAFLIKNKDVNVFGVHFTTGFEPAHADSGARLASHLSEQMEIPVHVVDLSRLFRVSVVDYFIRSYQEGITPNPCLVCNPVIKFDALYSAAKDLGADRLATGHYVRVTRDAAGVCHLLKGRDHAKDQSYFLAFLSQKQLSNACFPLGDLTKDEVRQIASETGLTPVSRNESQDVCFIPEGRYCDFIGELTGRPARPGPVVTVDGETIGRHEGLHRFTVGQRRGINCPSSEPYYVIRLLPDTNTLLVGRKQDLEKQDCRVSQVRWIGPKPALPFSADVRLRYRHRAVPATITEDGNGEFTVTFQAPQSAPTPGQGAVFYIEDEVIGAGIIAS